MGEGFSLVEYVIDLKELVEEADGELRGELEDRVYHYFRWLRQNMSRLFKDPIEEIGKTLDVQPTISIPRREYFKLGSEGGLFESRELIKIEEVSVNADFDACLMTLVGHSGHVTSVSFNRDGRLVAS